MNFNPSRKLEFDVGRPLQFDSRRPLVFDPQRDLGFAPNRNLGFGRRGVVFRGFVCPICGAMVAEDAVRCGECGAVFESTPRAAGPPTPTLEKPAPKPKGRPAAPPTAQRPRAAFCAFCGVELKATDMFCWNCGTQRVDSYEVTRLPAQKPLTKERRESRRR